MDEIALTADRTTLPASREEDTRAKRRAASSRKDYVERDVLCFLSYRRLGDYDGVLLRLHAECVYDDEREPEDQKGEPI